MFGLHNQINTFKHNGSSIADYYHKLSALWKQYAAMIELPKCVCNASEGFKKHDQLLKLMQFLMGLDDSCMQIRSSILSRETLPNVRSTYATISSEEFTELSSRGSGLVCENYSFNGHTIDRCFKIIGYPVDFGKKKSGQNFKKQNNSNNNSIGKSSSFGFSDEQMATVLSLIKDNKIRKTVHANMAGVNQHMTYTAKGLDNVVDISHLKIKVGHPNRIEAFISKIGNLKLSNGLTLTGDQCEGLYYYNEQEPVMNVLKKSLNFDNLIRVYVVSKFCVDKGGNSFEDVDYDKIKDATENVFQDVNHINFFDLEYPEIPNDDERVHPNLNCDNKKSHSASSSSFESGGNSITADFPVNSGNDADSSDNNFATQGERLPHLKKMFFSKGNVDKNPNTVSQDNQNLRRSSRQSVFPKNYNDFVVDSKVKYGIEKYVGYSKLNSDNYCFLTQLNKNFEPKSFSKASKFSHWIDAMNQEMNALLRNGTWEIVDLPKGRKATGCKWIYKIKFQSSGEIDRFKARLLAQGFGQKEGIDYEETFSLVVKMVTVRCLLNVAVSQSWPIFKLDVNNAFLYGDLDEDVYMRPPEGYFPSDNKTDKGVFLALHVYVNDIIITGNNVAEIENFKVFLKSKFMIKDLEKLKYFLGIEVVDTDKGICLNQRIYVLDLLSEYGMLACEPVDTTLYSKLIISNEATTSDPVLENITDYQKLMGLGIQFVKTSGMFLSAFSMLIGSKKQNTLSKSSTEAEYRALASVTSEVIWILKTLKDLKIENLLPINLHCNSNSAIKIAANLIFHERTKHLEIDLHFVREKILKGVVKIVKVDSVNQIANVFTKGLGTVQHKKNLEKLGMYDIYQVKMKGGC
ncbi:ribonuclease H-like domain-containing protein [Tanacetum coccineum]